MPWSMGGGPSCAIRAPIPSSTIIPPSAIPTGGRILGSTIPPYAIPMSGRIVGFILLSICLFGFEAAFLSYIAACSACILAAIAALALSS